MRSGGWMKQGSSWYYLSGSGATDGLAEQGRLLYMAGPREREDGHGLGQGIDGKWYYFEGSGAMRSGGWMKQGGTWYYLNGSEPCTTGWLDLDGKRYISWGVGAMVTERPL